MAIVVLGLGCDDGVSGTAPGNTTAAGSEGGACYGNGRCDVGLTCASRVCVRLPDAGVVDGGSGCSARSGQYLLTTVVTSGDCMPPLQRVITDANESVECGYPVQNSPDLCVTTVDETCTVLGTTITFKGTIRWNQDGTVGKGTFERGGWSLSGPVCTGVYDMTFTKL